LEAVAADESYAHDTMSGDAVIAHLKRLLAEKRDVLFEDEGAVALSERVFVRSLMPQWVSA
jgi:thiamine phosphate synthase YjbQ (UPF0047 family)